MPKKNNHQHNNSVAPQAARPHHSPSSATDEPAAVAKTVSVVEKSALEKSVERNVRPFIDLIDRLRGLQIERDIPIPQIAVMGDQSSGKSSVLEAISGVPFPRGAGLVTRCATQLILKKTPKGTPWRGSAKVNWENEQPEGAGELESVEAVGDAISKLTEALIAKAASDFSTHSIIIEVEAPEVPDLTVIDLPGIVRTTTTGQDKSVIEDVNNLIDTYLKQERTIILAVIPSNVDIATVDILERAQIVDPDGDRTIGVLTKPDLIDAGGEVEVMKVLTNEKKALTLGYVMVKNRSQKEIDDGMSLAQAASAERRYFSNHAHFGELLNNDSRAADRFGVTNLTMRLTKLLVRRIKDVLPTMKKEVESKMKVAESKLEAMPLAAPSTTQEKHSVCISIAREYDTLFAQLANGKYSNSLLLKSPNEAVMRLFTRVHEASVEFKAAIAELEPDFMDEDFLAKLETEIREMRGRELAGFLSFDVFVKVMCRYVGQWTPSTEIYLKKVDEILNEVTTKTADLIVPHFPAVCGMVKHVAKSLIKVQRGQAKAFVKDWIDCEKTPNTMNHLYKRQTETLRKNALSETLRPKFRDAREQVQTIARWDDENARVEHTDENMKKLEKSVQDTLIKAGHEDKDEDGTPADSNAEAMEAVEMARNLSAYWKVATTRFVDVIVMGIDQLHTEMLMKMLQPDDGMELFQEDEELVEQRERLHSQVERLRHAQQAFLDVRLG